MESSLEDFRARIRELLRVRPWFAARFRVTTEQPLARCAEAFHRARVLARSSPAFFCLLRSTGSFNLYQRIVGVHRPHVTIKIGQSALVRIERERSLNRI